MVVVVDLHVLASSLFSDGSALPVFVDTSEKDKTHFSPSLIQENTTSAQQAALVYLREYSKDGGPVGNDPLGAEDLALPHFLPHHDPSHVWLLTGHL